MLLDADVDYKTMHGETALSNVCLSGFSGMASLLKYGADVNYKIPTIQFCSGDINTVGVVLQYAAEEDHSVKQRNSSTLRSPYYWFLYHPYMNT